jgi:signal transduction histidine kinase/CheY-like chemotaxis protein
MVAVDTKVGAEGDDVASETDDLHVQALHLVLFSLATLAIFGHFFLTARANDVDPTRFGFMGGIVVATGLSYRAMRYGPAVAASILVVALSALLITGLLVFRESLLAFWFAPLVIIAGVLVGWGFGLSVTVITSAVILIDRTSTLAMSDDVATNALFLTWVSLLICWLLSHPTRTALGWAWHSYVRAMQITEEVRHHQEKLEGTVKSLNGAYRRLEQLSVDLARARQAAEEARRLKSEFAAAISHELRTPLNLIIGFSEMMVTAPQAYRDQALPDVYRGDIEAIYRNACHLSNLVDDVLDLSQIEADRMGLQKELLHLAPVVDEAITTIARLFSAKGLSLSVQVPLDLPSVFADRTRVRQVLINLLNNAARFTNVGGVTVQAWGEGSDVIVAVIDTGIGIAPQSLPVVFEEFRQVHVLGERRVVGSGLGLAVSKQFVELHGGSMWVESRPGEGSTFYFSLPSCETVITASGSPPAEHWLPSTTPLDGTDRAILVIDRDGEAARMFGRHLDGYRILAAPGIEAGRRLSAESVVHAAVAIGVNGPPDSGTLRRMGEAFPDVPVVSCHLSTRKVTAHELGVADCLTKPVGREQIRLSLRHLGAGIRTILIVDDDIEMVRLLGRLVRLASRRYVIWEARSGQEALSLLRAKRPDAILLDLIMPDLSGDELLRRLRDTGLGDIPVILVTGHEITDEKVTAEYFGITQRGGLSVRELMRCLRASLQAVHRPQATLLQHLQQRGLTDGLRQEAGSSHGDGQGAFVHDGADNDGDVTGRLIALEKV